MPPSLDKLQEKVNWVLRSIQSSNLTEIEQVNALFNQAAIILLAKADGTMTVVDSDKQRAVAEPMIKTMIAAKYNAGDVALALAGAGNAILLERFGYTRPEAEDEPEAADGGSD